MSNQSLDFMPLARFVDQHPSRCYDEMLVQYAKLQLDRINEQPPAKPGWRQEWSVPMMLSGWCDVDVCGGFARELMALVPPVDWGCWCLRMRYGSLDIRRNHVPMREHINRVLPKDCQHVDLVTVRTCQRCQQREQRAYRDLGLLSMDDVLTGLRREQFIIINEQTVRHKMWVGMCAGCSEVEMVMCCNETWREVYGGEV